MTWYDIASVLHAYRWLDREYPERNALRELRIIHGRRWIRRRFGFRRIVGGRLRARRRAS